MSDSVIKTVIAQDHRISEMLSATGHDRIKLILNEYRTAAPNNRDTFFLALIARLLLEFDRHRLLRMENTIGTNKSRSWLDISNRFNMPPNRALVLLYDKNANEPVWPGYLDGDMWRYADGMPAQPTHWAEMPEGPEV